jgi:TonB family protein
VTLLAGLVIRSSVMLLAGLLLTRLLHRRSAALRHRVLAVSLAAAVLVGPLSLVLSIWTVPLPDLVSSAADVPLTSARSDRRAESPPAAARRSAASTAGPAVPPVETIALSAWLAGALVFAAVVMVGLASVARITARASDVAEIRWRGALDALCARFGVTRQVRLARTTSSDVLATWGWRSPRVLLPCDACSWSDDRIHVVLCHELAHIRRNDWLVQVGVEFVRALFWFNPLAWIACTRLRRESELACDDEVLGAGVGGRDYAAQLVALARQFRRRGPVWLSAMPMAHPSTLERRIRAMLNPAVDRRLPPRRVMAGLAAALLVVMVPLVTLRAGQAGPAPLGGTIYDVSGGVLPGVKVTLMDSNEVKLEATTNASGRFDLPPVGPGKYLLTAGLVGFGTLRQEIELRETNDWERTVTLQIGELRESVRIRGSRAGATAAAARTGATPIRVGGNIRVPKKVRDVKPVFPESMREAGLTGVVPVEALIGVDGSVVSLRVLSAQAHPDFAIAAVDAVRQWQFTPTLLNGQPVEVRMNVTITFDLE